MTPSNLAMVVFASTIIYFITSRMARRNDNPQLQLFVKALRIFIFGLVAVYFYKRFVG